MKTFDDLSLIAPLAQALSEEDYVTPTAIQARTIPQALNKRDILGCAQTGTGKTAAFALPILNALGGRNRKSIPNRPFALVLAPTRELAGQIEESFRTYARHLRLRTCVVYGGVRQTKQVRALDRGAHVLIATPGRLLDLIGQGHIDLSRLEFFVLDEADRMLDMGFLPAIREIISLLPEKRQSLFFSATLGRPIVDLSQQLLRDAVEVNVSPKQVSVAEITQQVIHTEPREKKRLLRRLLRDPAVTRAVVFTRTKRGANTLARILQENDIAASAIHGNKSQNARERALSEFRRGRINVLVATDVASRGIDIDDISHVVNFDIPHEPEAYVHRIGRTGRAGREGTAITFCTPGERGDLRAIEQLIGHSISATGDAGAEVPRRQADKSDAPKSPSRGSKRRQRNKPAAATPAAAGPAAKKPRRRRRRPRRTPAPTTTE